jgi:DNA-binding IclR family transcriptional regulator
MLLDYDEQMIDKLIEEKALISLTKNSITTKEDLLNELKKIQGLGYALDDEECELGARCIAAPVRDFTGKIVAGISLSGPVTRMTMDKINNIKDIIIEISNRMSKDFGYSLE